MLSSNQIAEFCDHQYLWKEKINDLDFLHQGKKASKTTAFGWVWPDVASHAQTCLYLSEVNSSGVVWLD